MDNIDSHLASETLLPTKIKEKSIIKSRDITKNDKELIFLDIVLGSIGNPVAELEEEELDDYFIRTAQYEAAIKGRQSLFIGSKGTGKTANFIQLGLELSEDRRNIVCAIKPSDYKLSRFLNAFRNVSDLYSGAVHVAENVWKFVWYCEIVSRFYFRITDRPISTGRSEEEEDFLKFWEKHQDIITAPFEKKLELTAEWLENAQFDQDNFSEIIHKQFISEANKKLRPIIKKDSKIFLIVDNLDKAWERGQDLNLQALLFFALMGLGRRIENDLGTDVKINLIIFLRRNIYEFIRKSREPDKLLTQSMQMIWANPDMLLRVIERRVEVACERNCIPPIDIWNNLFTKEINGIETTQWIINNIIPRPRDLIRFVQYAMESAFNASRQEIIAEDLQNALKLYSAFAINQIIAEYKEENLWISELIHSFSGMNNAIKIKDLERHIKSYGFHKKYHINIRDMIIQLVVIGFLGLELNENDIRYALQIEDGLMLQEKIKNHPANKPLYLIIHPAFRPHLGLKECPKNKKPLAFKLIDLVNLAITGKRTKF